MSEPLIKTIRLECSVEHAFDVFTTRVDAWWPPGHKKWDDSKLVLEPRAGGRFFERAPTGEESLLGEVLTVEPPACIRYTWWPGAVQAPTWVEVTFARDNGGTIVRVEHREADSQLGELWHERVKRFQAGWDAVMSALLGFTQSERQRRNA